MQEKARLAGLNWQVDSAGTNGYHVGEPPHRLSQKVALSRGLDISHQCSRKFEAADFDRYDMIYAMASDVLDDMRRIAGNRFKTEKADLLLNILFPGELRDVPDPFYGPEPGYHEVYDLIESACDRIIAHSTRTQHV
ncbi:putative low molecular weight protein-tyrosine phosphatase [Flavihumibacter petaseus NBRC 106054]|uniref:protein-tyrosine-phosphatase n=2 Tax=Flavihumibacter TaxID=1004301 RepID=A0A0E9MVA0_9BACT|nr:putative low molecular weight protein-tyrosine phosphatase [Flavihumibacter petaseus NBRC 106054]